MVRGTFQIPVRGADRSRDQPGSDGPSVCPDRADRRILEGKSAVCDGSDPESSCDLCQPDLHVQRLRSH